MEKAWVEIIREKKGTKKLFELQLPNVIEESQACRESFVQTPPVRMVSG